MTELRDARLQRALQEAPDAQLRPDARTRSRVLEAARQAVAPAPRPAWWKTLWSATGNSRAPWNAALATVLLAILVTVLWYDREVPGPRSDSPRLEQPPPAEPAAPTAAPPPAPPAAPATQAAPSAAPKTPPAEPTPPAPALAEPGAPAAARAKPPAEPQRRRLQAQSPSARRDAAPAPSQPGAADTQQAAPAAEAKREQRGETAAPAALESRSAPAAAPAEALRDRAASALEKSRSERADSTAPRGAAATAPVVPLPQPAPQPTPAAPPVASPAPPSAAAVAPAAPAPAGAPFSGLAGQRAAPGPANDWTGMRISDALGNRVELSRDQAPRLAQLASGLARVTQGREPLGDRVEIRIELRRAGELQALLELAGAQVRWTDAAGASFTARPPEAQLQALREEAARLLRR